MAGFSAPGPADVPYRHFGITPEAVVAQALRLLDGAQVQADQIIYIV
jgi:transketolase